MNRTAPPPVALTIAGSDSGGGAGIQADLKTFHQWRVFGTSALTAVTAQNTLGVQAVQALPASLVEAQIRSVTADFPVAAVKSGMLATREIVEAVAGVLRDRQLTGYVLDPVMVATSGDRLLAPEAAESIQRDLLPLAAIVTPNWPEARLLTGVRRNDLKGMEEAARILLDAGAGAVLIKGGHLAGSEGRRSLSGCPLPNRAAGEADRDPAHARNRVHPGGRDHRRAGCGGRHGRRRNRRGGLGPGRDCERAGAGGGKWSRGSLRCSRGRGALRRKPGEEDLKERPEEGAGRLSVVENLGMIQRLQAKSRSPVRNQREGDQALAGGTRCGGLGHG